jgi:ubiquitin carboxyl-terminal hydrolase 4/11/15
LWKGQPYSWFIDADHNGEAKDSDEPTFHDIGVPVVSNRKVVGTPVAADGSITVPVYTCKTPEPGRYRNSNDGPSQCEIQPFFITLSKTEATDPVAVREAISRGYGRFVRSESKPRLWVPQGHHRAASHLPVVHDEEQDKSEEGNKEPEQDSEQATATDNGDEKETPPDNDDPKPDLLQPEPTLLRNASSTSLSSVGSVKPGAKLVPRGDLFKVHVADASTADGAGGLNMFKSKEPIVPLWKGNFSSATGSWSIVENRRKAKKNMLNRLTSGINSIVNYASDDEASPPATPVAPPPVVRPGEGIFVEWSHKRFHEFFASHPSHRTDEIVDPAIAKERSKDKGKAISIEDCLDEFSKEETLGQDDLWYCPQVRLPVFVPADMSVQEAPGGHKEIRDLQGPGHSRYLHQTIRLLAQAQ